MSATLSPLVQLPVGTGPARCGGQAAAKKQRIEPLQIGFGYLSQVYRVNETSILKVYDGHFYSSKMPQYVVEGAHISDVLYANEVYAFSALHHLQGTVVPRLLDYGCYYNGEVVAAIEGPYILMSNVGSVRPNTSSQAHYDLAACALEHIHACGVVHGDIRIQNMMLTGDTVTFIDFGHSRVFDKPDTDEEFARACAQDWQRLRNIFSPN
ncbi:hypothetical protein TRVA0_007S04082 [Trichomonascus vanleenenianus]|uniref:uncharacterized protein n=1 Tax=Trichomonascus vanleenenianus TaxID=2268995 RepID=UPI003ECA5829